MYEPTLGRFLSRDPLSEHAPQILYPFPDLGQFLSNPYVYVGNRPVTLTDPSGLAPKKACHTETERSTSKCKLVVFGKNSKDEKKDTFIKQVGVNGTCKYLIGGNLCMPGKLVAGQYVKGNRKISCEHVVLTNALGKEEVIWAAGECKLCPKNVIVINCHSKHYPDCCKEYLELAKKLFQEAGFTVVVNESNRDITKVECP